MVESIKYQGEFMKVILMAMAISTSLLAQEILLVSDPWPPYMYGKEGSPVEKGSALNAVDAIFKEAGLNLKTLLCPWKRCLALIEDGKFDGGLFLGKNSEREAYMLFSDPIVEVPTVLWYKADRADAIDWNSWSDLEKYKIAIVPTYNYGDEFKKEREVRGLQLFSGKTEPENLQKVLSGDVDCMPGNRVVIQHMIDQNPELKGKFKYAMKPLTTSSYHLSFSKKSSHKGQLDKVNAAIKKLRGSGQLDKFFQ